MTGAIRPRLIVGRLVAPLVVAIVASLLFFAPKLGFVWPCPVNAIFHVPCPSCGLTRATRLAAHGELAAATHMHPLWMVVLPFLATVLCVEMWKYLHGEPWGGAGRIRALRLAGYATVTLLIVVWIARFFGAFGGPLGSSS